MHIDTEHVATTGSESPTPTAQPPCACRPHLPHDEQHSTPGARSYEHTAFFGVIIGMAATP